MNATVVRLAALLRNTQRFLREQIFGYDFFVSYAQEDSTRAYGEALQALLTERDFVVFRDITHLAGGDKLTLRIRWSLWRTRCLVVLGTELALGSPWVAKEIGLFAERKRRIVPLDLQNIRLRSPWKEVDDARFVNDLLPGPSIAVVDEIAASLTGWRANRMARAVLAGLAVLTLAVGGVLTWQALSLREGALQLRARALAAMAQSQPDPLLRSLILAEADTDRLPPDAARTARECAKQPMPLTILRASMDGITNLAAGRDSKWLFTTDDDGVLRRWPVDGTSDSVQIGRLDWHPYRVEALASMLLCCNQSRAVLVAMDGSGPTPVIEKPEEPGLLDEPAKDSPPEPVAERWLAADGSSAWRAAPDGTLVVCCADAHLVHTFLRQPDGSWLKDSLKLPGRAVLDIHLSERAADGTFTGLLVCTDGATATFDCDGLGKFTPVWGPPAALAEKEHVQMSGKEADSRAIVADGKALVVGLGSEAGLVVAELARQWKPRVYRPGGERKLKSWTLSPDGQTALLLWDNLDLVSLRLADFQETPQLSPGRVQVLTATDFAAGASIDTAMLTKDYEPPELGLPALAPDGETAVVTTVREAWHWSLKAGRPLGTLRAGFLHETSVRPVFTPDGACIVTAGNGGELRVWPVHRDGFDPRVTSLGGKAFKLAGGGAQRFLVGTEKGDVFLSEPGTAAKPRHLHRHEGHLARCAVSPDGTHGAAVFADGRMALFALPSGELRGSVQVACKDAEFVSDTLVLAFGGVKPALVDVTTKTILAHGDGGWEVVYPSGRGDSKRVLVRKENGALDVHQLPGLERLRTLGLPASAGVVTAALSASGTWAAAGLRDGRVLMFATATGTLRSEFRVDNEKGWVFDVTFSPDERWLAFATEEGRAGVIDWQHAAPPLWFQAPDLETATGVAMDRHAHAGIAMHVRFSADGTRLVTCSGLDSHTRVWKVDGTCLDAMHTGGVATFASLLNNGQMLNLTEQGELAVWTVGVRDLLARLRARSNAVLLAPERMRYLGEDAATAYDRYSVQERQRGRSPLDASFTRIDYR